MADCRYIARGELAAICAGRLAGTRLDGLFAIGSLESLAAPTVAIVGSRAPSDAGRRLAGRLAADLGSAGVCVISGLALGIDSAAHAGSLAAGAPTIGVLGGGHARFFPARNRELAERIVAGGGAVVSPYEPQVPARPHQFLARNGVIAALADALVVVEAAARSGSLNTASWAADRAIPVMAFPGDVDRPKVAGCLALIRDGALLVRGAEDVLAQLGLGGNADRVAARPGATADSRTATLPGAAADTGGANRPTTMTALARHLVERLAREPARVDALLDERVAPSELLACLGELLAAGIIVESSDATLRLRM